MEFHEDLNISNQEELHLNTIGESSQRGKRGTGLTEPEELELMNWVKSRLETVHETPKRQEIVEKATEIAMRELGRSSISANWVTGFQKRHAELFTSPATKKKSSCFGEQEEREIASWIEEQNKTGINPGRTEVQEYALQIAKKKDPSRASLPQNWLTGFHGRYPGLRIARYRKKSETEETTEAYVEEPLQDEDITKKDHNKLKPSPSGHRAVAEIEEEELVQWVENKNKIGELPTRTEVLTKITEILRRRDPFRSGLSRSWAADFQRRNPNLRFNIKETGLTNPYFKPNEEKEIVDWITEQNSKGVVPSQIQVRDFAVQVAQKRDPKKTSFSRNWFVRFQRVYPDLKISTLEDKAKIQLLEKEEKDILQWIKNERDKGVLVSTQQIVEHAAQILQKKDPNVDVSGVPEKWLEKMNEQLKKRSLEDPSQPNEKRTKT